MGIFRNLAYGVSIDRFPLIAIVGLVTYASFLSTIALVSAKRWSKRLRRVPVRVHRWLAIWSLACATLHLLMGISTYV